MIRKCELKRTFAPVRDLPPHARNAIEELSAFTTSKLLYPLMAYMKNSGKGQENQETLMPR